MNKIQIEPKWKDVKPRGHYVYIHIRESTGEPFYVGLGQNKRGWAYSAESRGSWWKRTAIKHGVALEITHDGLDRDSAELLEMWLIAKFRHEGVSICNLTNGGDGALGARHSAHSKSLISSSKTGMPRSISTRISLGKPVFCSNGLKFETVSLAVEYLIKEGRKKATQSSISQCCAGKLKTAYGLKWSFDGFVFPVESPHSLSIPVVTSCGEYFHSVTEASLAITGKIYGSSNICACLKGRQKTAYGRNWHYAASLQ